MVRNNTRGSLPAWEKPVDQGSNPCVPMPYLWNEEKSGRISTAAIPVSQAVPIMPDLAKGRASFPFWNLRVV